LKKNFYSNGKLLITAEYLVLEGAKAFALPTKFGQNLVIEDSLYSKIHWESYDVDNTLWFNEDFTLEEIKTFSKFDSEENNKNTLLFILNQAHLLNPKILSSNSGFNITTQLTFSKNWGLGSSSTLINNIAQWFEIDAFKLLKNSFKGSGYDIACAQNNTPITFQLINAIPKVKAIYFNPNFTSNIYFVYLNKKQNSREAIKNFYANKENSREIIPIINNITNTIMQTSNLEEFARQLQLHEDTLSKFLKTKTIKETYFADFEGAIKSLGAWGGDFVMAIYKDDPKPYFEKKGYKTILNYKDLILQS
jgi:mevalonate kinase